MEWFNDLLSYLTSGVNVAHPIILVALFAIGVISEIGFPLLFSLEIFLFFISYDYGPLSSQALFTVLMLLLGREAGANLLYLITRLLGSRFLDWIERRSSRTFKAVESFKVRLNRKPAIMVALVRLTPGLLQVPSITAGTIRLRPVSFVNGVAISSLIYDFIFILLGFSARFALPHLNTQPKTYLVIGFAVLIAIVWVILFFYYRYNSNGERKKQKERLV